jgi:YesN/AraC family two-component response regulator
LLIPAFGLIGFEAMYNIANFSKSEYNKVFLEIRLVMETSFSGEDIVLSYRLVIIDDEREISNGFARFFPWKELGFTVVGQFSGAKSALQFIKKNSVDVVISDVIMPGMTGIDLAKELADTRLSPQPLVVLFSAHDEFEYARQALKYRCADYILKSAQFDELIAVFSRLKERIDKERNIISENDSDGGDKIISLIRDYVKRNVREANLGDASALVYLSPSYVSRYFKQKTSVSFSEYVIEQKMIFAASLLSDLQYKVYDVSLMAGYTNPVNFTRSFKRFHGVPPREYRSLRFGRVKPDNRDDAE